MSRRTAGNARTGVHVCRLGGRGLERRKRLQTHGASCSHWWLPTTSEEEESPMRLTTVLRRLLGVIQMHVKDAHLGYSPRRRNLFPINALRGSPITVPTATAA